MSVHGCTVSVVVPSYNRSSSLARLLAALASDDVRLPREIIVVDDGSTDSTTEVARSWGARCIRTHRAGPAAARNAGWRAATGDVVVFTDDDCVPSPRWVDQMAAPLLADDTVAGVGGQIVPLRHGFIEDFSHAERLADHGRTPSGTVRYLVTAAAAYRRSTLARVDGFDEGFGQPAGEDVDLSIRVLRDGGRLVLEPAAVVAHDYRGSLRSLVRTYWRHGAARHGLAARHPSLAVGSSTSSALSARAVAERFARYREYGSRSRSVSFVLLRCICMLVYLTAFTRSKQRDRR